MIILSGVGIKLHCNNDRISSLFLPLSLQVVATFTQRKEESFTETGSTPLPPPSLEVAETDVGIQTFPSIPLTTPVRVSPTSTSHAAREQEEIFHQQACIVHVQVYCVCMYDQYLCYYK